MPSLAQRLAEVLDAESATLPGTSIEAVFLTGRLVCLPHLSYAQWPPNEYLHVPFSSSARGLKSHWRGVSRTASTSYKVASWLDLTKSESFSWNLRKKIKRSQQQSFEILTGKSDLLDDFWDIYAISMHRLGSLPLPKRFFHALLTGFDEGYAEIFLLYRNKEVVGGACNICVNRFYENAWFATSKASQKFGSSYFLHQSMIDHAKQIGCEIYSFGRSTRGSGVHCFKKQWNTDDVSLIWQENGQLIKGNPYPFKKMGRLLALFPFPLVRQLGDWAFKRIY